MINVTKLKQQLKQGDLKNIYLFCGEEKYLIENYIKKVTDMALRDGMAELNLSSYNEDNESYDSIVNDIEGYPVMSDKKVIILKNIKLLKLKDYQKPFISLFENIPDYAIVIIEEDELSKVKKPMLDAIGKKGEVVEFKKQNVSDLKAWLNRLLAEGSKAMNSTDADYLINMCERSMEKISVEAKKLISSTDEQYISRKNIDALVKIPVEYKIFEMSDKLMSGDADSVYKILNGFKITKVQPIVIFSVIYGQLSDLYMFKTLAAEGKNAAEFLPANRKWLAGKLSADCRRHSSEKLRRGMELCAKYDVDVKMGKIDGYAAVEMMIAELLA